MKATPTRLLIVDDHPVVRDGLRSVPELAPEIEIVGEAGSVEEALAAAAQWRPDVILLDIRLRGRSGIDVCRAVKSVSPAVRVVFLTSYSNDEFILSALGAGADGYLLKENDTRRVVEAIREVMSGGAAFFDSEVKHSLSQPRTVQSSGNPLAALSAQECRLLEEVARGKTDKEVALALGLTPKTARNYLDRVFAKLKVHTRTEAAMLHARFSQQRPAGT
jgi:DNA-binding NarL/FixJ family response regulator